MDEYEQTGDGQAEGLIDDPVADGAEGAAGHAAGPTAAASATANADAASSAAAAAAASSQVPGSPSTPKVRNKATRPARPTANADAAKPSYDIGDEVFKPRAFDPSELLNTMTATAKALPLDSSSLRREIDQLAAKAAIASKTQRKERRVIGVPGRVALTRTSAMDGAKRRAADPPNQPVEINFEILGTGDPGISVPVVVTPKTRKGMEAAREVAEELVLRFGCKVLLWDRPNCGASGICFEGYGSEAEMQSDFLHLLLGYLELQPVVLYGNQMGGRLSLLHALRYPQDVGGLVLDNLPAGSSAARYHARKFYMQYLDILYIYNKNGMLYVSKEKHYQRLCEANPNNLPKLLAFDQKEFKKIMNRWAKPLAETHDKWLYPVLGLEAPRLRAIDVPAVCMYSWPSVREEDAMHTEDTMASALECLPNSHHTLLTDFKPGKLDGGLGHWLMSLPRPLQAYKLRASVTATAETLAVTTARMAMNALRLQAPEPGQGCDIHSFDTWLRTTNLRGTRNIGGQQGQPGTPGGSAAQQKCSIM